MLPSIRRFGFPTTTAAVLLLFSFLQFSTTILAMTYKIQGKKALITGSAGGIGKGIALELVNRGAQVIIHYNTREKEAMELKDQLQDQCLGVLHCDFRKPETIPTFMSNVQDLCCCGSNNREPNDNNDDYNNGLDILVNNAGQVTKMALEDDNNSLDVWHETMAVNLHAPNLLSKLAVELSMKSKKKGGGVIINVSSIHGEKSNEYIGAYAASKSALDSLTRTMAIEYSPYNVRVNAISPGVVPVERTQAALLQDGSAQKHAWEERIPLHKLGSVKEVAQATMPLIENEWITGTIWTIDGGMMSRANMPVRDRPCS